MLIHFHLNSNWEVVGFLLVLGLLVLGLLVLDLLEPAGTYWFLVFRTCWSRVCWYLLVLTGSWSLESAGPGSSGTCWFWVCWSCLWFLVQTLDLFLLVLLSWSSAGAACLPVYFFGSINWCK